jgi:hypothetical protein
MGKDGRDSQTSLGERLVKRKLISPLQLHKAIEMQRSIGGRLGHQLTKLGYIEEDELTAFLSHQYGVPSINLSAFEIDPEVLEIVPTELVSRHHVIPVNHAGNTLILAMSDPSNIYAIDDVRFITNCNVEVVVASDAAIAEAIGRYYTVSTQERKGLDAAVSASSPESKIAWALHRQDNQRIGDTIDGWMRNLSTVGQSAISEHDRRELYGALVQLVDERVAARDNPEGALGPDGGESWGQMLDLKV